MESQTYENAISFFCANLAIFRIYLVTMLKILTTYYTLLQRCIIIYFSLQVFASAPPHVVSSGASINTTTHLLRLRNGFVPVSGEHHPHHHHRTRREASPSAPSANRSQVVPILQRPKAFAPSPNHVVFADPNNNVCANCPAGGAQNPLSLLTTVLASLDFVSKFHSFTSILV